MAETAPLGIVRGPIAVEDLIRVPGNDCIVASGQPGPGTPQDRFHAVDRRDPSRNETFAYLASFALDAARFGVARNRGPARFVCRRT